MYSGEIPTSSEAEVYHALSETPAGNVILEFIANCNLEPDIEHGKEEVDDFVNLKADEAVALFTGTLTSPSPFLGSSNDPNSEIGRITNYLGLVAAHRVIISLSGKNKPSTFVEDKERELDLHGIGEDRLELPLRVMGTFVKRMTQGGSSTTQRERR